MPLAITRLYRRLRFGKPVIVVSGLPRSGTSMTMQMLEAGGVEILTDGVREADESNPVGYYELEKVKELDKGGDKSWLTEAKGKAVKIISYLLPHLPETLNYKILFMHRDLDEIIASQNKMLELRGEPQETSDERTRELFEDHLWRARRLLAHRSCFDVLEVSHRDVINQPREQAGRLDRFLGGGLVVESMTAVVDERLYRNRR
jgi:hypothetical protein